MKSFLGGLSKILSSRKAPSEEKPSPPPVAPVGKDSTTPATPLANATQTSSPSPETKRNPAKDRLYGNLPLDQWPPLGGDVTATSWSEFDAARNYLAAGQTDQAIACWQEIIATPGHEALHYVQAWHFLRQNGVQPPEEDEKNVYGVIGEQGKSGIMVAVYIDGQARLYGDQGQAIVWTHPDDSLDSLIESVLGAAASLMRKVKQSDPRIESSLISINSISVLTPSGVYTKIGAQGSFEATPLIKPITDRFALFTKALMEKAGQTPKG